MTDVAGRTAFITGGANGIGLGIARALAAGGAKVALADLDTAALYSAKAELSQTTEVETVVIDVRDREAFARVADDVEAKLGPVSILCNNAGVSGGAPAGKLGYDLWDWSLGINLGGVVNGVTTFLPRIVERGMGGHIINTASGAGLVGTASGALYCTSKFAIVGMSEALRAELLPQGIGISVLCPGPVSTDIIARSGASKPTATLTDEQRQKIGERESMMTAILHQGTTPDTVGQMVLAAINENRLYIHTDRIMLPFLVARQEELLAAMPPEVATGEEAGAGLIRN